MIIRTAGKALIIRKDEILLIKHKKDQVYYTLPGGGQNHNESIKTCLKRECLEEIGYDVKVDDLVFLYEYIGDLDDHPEKGYHQVDMVFKVNLKDKIHDPIEMDLTQIGSQWIKLNDLMDYLVYPMAIREKILNYVSFKNQRTYFSNEK